MSAVCYNGGKDGTLGTAPFGWEEGEKRKGNLVSVHLSLKQQMTNQIKLPHSLPLGLNPITSGGKTLGGLHLEMLTENVPEHHN